MTVSIGGAPSSGVRNSVRHFAAAALAALDADLDLVVDIGPWRHSAPSDGTLASTDSERVWLHGWLVAPVAPEPAAAARFEFVFSEEIAHFVLFHAGVPHEGDRAVFFQELFATWFKYGHVVVDGGVPSTWLQVHPIPVPGEAYEVGTHLGAALATSRASRERLDAWLSCSPGADADLVRLVHNTEATLATPLRSQQVASAYRDAPRTAS